MTAPGVREIPADQLTVDPEVQRNLDPKRVEKLAASWDDRMVGIITVSHRAPRAGSESPTGAYVVLDGQTRLAAFRRVCGEATTAPMLAQVHERLTKPEEASIFLEHNDRKAVTPHDQFRLALTAMQPEALAVHEITTRHGWVARGLPLELNGSGRPLRRFAAIGAVLKIYRMDGGAALDRALTTIGNVWPGRSQAVVPETLYGFGTLFARHPEITSKDAHGLVRKMARIPFEQFTGDVVAESRRYRRSVAVSAYSQVLAIYNSRRDADNRLDP
jgi:hypothetical protein